MAERVHLAAVPGGGCFAVFVEIFSWSGKTSRPTANERRTHRHTEGPKLRIREVGHFGGEIVMRHGATTVRQHSSAARPGPALKSDSKTTRYVEKYVSLRAAGDFFSGLRGYIKCDERNST